MGRDTLPFRCWLLGLLLLGCLLLLLRLLLHGCLHLLLLLGLLSLGHGGGLLFPGTDNPDYADFLYYAYIIGTSGQTADVSITSQPMRRISLMHCVLAYIFNTTVLALTINLAAGLL